MLDLNPKDMARRQLKDGDLVRVKSRRGGIALRACASQAFPPMHWGRRFMDSAGANALTIAAVDPHSKQPELKHAAIQVEKLGTPWRLVMLKKVGASGTATIQTLQPWLARFTHATLTLAVRRLDGYTVA